jgi:hypothetical protein
MIMGLLDTVASNVQSILSAGVQGIGSISNTRPSASGGVGASTQPADSTQLSPFAELMNTLQQMQQANPAKYQQVMGQIATNLEGAAKTATSQGNTAAATELNQIASDFANSSESGQLPNVLDLAKAIGGGHQHHHQAATSSDSGSGGVSQWLDKFQAAFQPNAPQDGSLNPASIIFSTLAGAAGSS